MHVDLSIECPICHGEGDLCYVCEGEGRVPLRRGDPWAILRRLRAHPCVEAVDPEREDVVGGADAIDALVELREMLDAALAVAPTVLARGG